MNRFRATGSGVFVLILATITAGGSGAFSPAAATPVGYAGPARVLNRAGDQLTSRNWDGYVTYAPGGVTDFNAIQARWVQPKVKCNAKNAWTVFWVGLDGWYDNTVEQGGTSAYCASRGGAPQYTLWWEMYPTNPIQTVLAINAGDKITASVNYSTSTSVFTIKVRDVTSGQGFTKKKQCASDLTCKRSSTDVITEDVGSYPAGTYFPLANYGTMGYSGIAVTNTAGYTGRIGNAHWQYGAITEEAAGITYATVSALMSAGTAFTTTWKHK